MSPAQKNTVIETIDSIIGVAHKNVMHYNCMYNKRAMPHTIVLYYKSADHFRITLSRLLKIQTVLCAESVSGWKDGNQKKSLCCVSVTIPTNNL